MNSSPLDDRGSISITDAAEYLSVSRKSIGRLIETGQLKVVYVGTKPLVTTESVRAFLRGNGGEA